MESATYEAHKLKAPRRSAFAAELASFRDFGKHTRVLSVKLPGLSAVPVFVNEFWTAKQRAASSLHEVSYRACFKPQLPNFFVSRLTEIGDAVYDPFMGRGTTLIESALCGRIPSGCDINPLSELLIRPRLEPPTLEEIDERLKTIRLRAARSLPRDLLTFYHHDTLQALCSMRAYFLRRQSAGTLDSVDRWLWMVALNRLTGHSPGFFSVYTLPPNQAVSVESQRKINRKRGQVPPKRDVRALMLRKSRQLLDDVSTEVRRTLGMVRRRSKLLSQSADRTPQIRSGSIDLVVTSPPFLDIVDYAKDNWLRCWFAGISASKVQVTKLRKVEDWQQAMEKVFIELERVLAPGGHVAFEVGEVRNGRLKLEEHVLRAGAASGLRPELVLVNDQVFTKTSNCWGVDNCKLGTNTNRVVLFKKR
ncbi:MAG: DNA methyltransferase [Bdellovibrionota bacterium]